MLAVVGRLREGRLSGRARRRTATLADAATRAEIRAQVHALNDLNQRAADECFRKCVPAPRDGDLAIGEMACIDRCVPKYLAAGERVAQELGVIRNAVVGGAPAGRPRGLPLQSAGSGGK